MNIICVLKSGGVYTPEYVAKLYNMVKRNTDINFQFICYTDNINLYTDTILYGMNASCNFTIKMLNFDLPGWWSKFEIFYSKEQCLFLDLDTIITGSLNSLILEIQKLKENEFIGLKDFSLKKQAKEETIFSSAIMGWNGDYEFILNDFIAEYDKSHKEKYPVEYRKPGDQVTISSILRNHNCQVKFWQDLVSGIYPFKREYCNNPPKDVKVICFYGSIKPINMTNTNLIRQYWR